MVANAEVLVQQVQYLLDVSVVRMIVSQCCTCVQQQV